MNNKFIKLLSLCYFTLVVIAFLSAIAYIIKPIFIRETGPFYFFETFIRDVGPIYLFFFPLTIFEVSFVPFYLRKKNVFWKMFLFSFSLAKISLITIWEVIFDVPHIISLFSNAGTDTFFIIMMFVKAIALTIMFVTFIVEIINIFYLKNMDFKFNFKKYRPFFITLMVIFGIHIISFCIWVIAGFINNAFDYENAIGLSIYHAIPRMIVYGSFLLVISAFLLLKDRVKKNVLFSLLLTLIFLGLILFGVRIAIADTYYWFVNAVFMQLPFINYMVVLLFGALAATCYLYYLIFRFFFSLLKEQ